MTKKPREEESMDGWKDTYGDMVTLLLCFFVLLYSMSSVDSEKWQAFVKAFTNPGEDTAQVVLIPGEQLGDHEVPGTTDDDGLGVESTTDMPTNFDQLYEYLKDYIEDNNMSASIDIAGSEGVVYLRYQNSLFFQPNSAELTAAALPNLEFLGTALKGLEDQIWMISISGHTAAVTNGNSSISDWELSGARAARVADYFEAQSQIDPKLLRLICFGKNYPVDTNDTNEGRQNNRRVELVIISNDSPIAESPEIADAVSGLFQAEPFESKDKMDSIEDLLDPSILEELTGGAQDASGDASSDASSAADSASGEDASSTESGDGGSAADSDSAASASGDEDESGSSEAGGDSSEPEE